MAYYRIDDELYDLNPMTWPNVDVSSVQRALGCATSEFVERFAKMDIDAVQATIWVLRRRADPGLRIDAVTFTLEEFLTAIELSDDEVREGWASLSDAPDERTQFLASQVTDDQRARMFIDGELIEEESVPLALAPVIETSAF